MVKLVFARHGESEWNKANLFTGWADVDLSEKGTQQAIDAGKLIKEAGIEYTIRQIDEYRACGIDGIHLYALNKWKDVSEIIDRSGLRTLV